MPSEAIEGSAAVVDGYIRVSRRQGRDGPSYISPDVQRESIQRWAEYKRVRVDRWHVDEDWSGGTHERPGLEACIERALQGEIDGIVSWKIDRFSRSTEDGLRDLRLLRDAGARLAFSGEDIDTDGPLGVFVYTILLAQATFFLDSIKAGWVESKIRGHGRGAKIGPTPFGYRRRKDGTLEPHPSYADTVRRVFDLAAGDLAAAVEYISGQDTRHEEGKRKGRERAWTATTVRRLLASRAYLGEAHYGDLEVNRDAHPPLVTRMQWEAAQQAPVRRRSTGRSFPLSGVAVCGSCGERLVGAAGGERGQRMYRCRASLTRWQGPRCPAPPTVTADLLEGYVREYLRPLLTGGLSIGAEAPGDLVAAEEELLAAEGELRDVETDLELRRTVGPDSFRRIVGAALDRVESAQQAYRVAASAAAKGGVELDVDLLDTDEGFQAVATAILDGGVSVSRGRKSIDQRVVFARESEDPEAGVSASTQ